LPVWAVEPGAVVVTVVGVVVAVLEEGAAPVMGVVVTDVGVADLVLLDEQELTTKRAANATIVHIRRPNTCLTLGDAARAHRTVEP
jgi:hypothetical protein